MPIVQDLKDSTHNTCSRPEDGSRAWDCQHLWSGCHKSNAFEVRQSTLHGDLSLLVGYCQVALKTSAWTASQQLYPKMDQNDE